jgi:hypothetical protein
MLLAKIPSIDKVSNNISAVVTVLFKTLFFDIENPSFFTLFVRAF